MGNLIYEVFCEKWRKKSSSNVYKLRVCCVACMCSACFDELFLVQIARDSLTS